MKRYDNLYDAIIDIENIRYALDKAAKNKHKQRQVREAILRKEELCQNIKRMLETGTYNTSKYKIKIIREPKVRTIYVLPFYPDRIVHHAIMNIIEPLLDKKLIDDCYSCRVMKGQMRASNKCIEYMKKYRYCLKGDISKFYPSINHNVLKNVLRRIFKDERLIKLLDNIIESIEGDVNVPIGNFLSQWFGNLYLNVLDRFLIDNKFSKICRYCDDFLIFSNFKIELLNLRTKIEEFCHSTLKVNLSKLNLVEISHQGLAFLGFRHYYHSNTSKVTVKLRIKTQRKFNKTILNIKNCLRYYDEHHLNILLDSNYELYKGQLASLIGWLKHTSYRYFSNYYTIHNLGYLTYRFGLFKLDLRYYTIKSNLRNDINMDFKDIADDIDLIVNSKLFKDILGQNIILDDFFIYNNTKTNSLLKLSYKFTEDGTKYISFSYSRLLASQLAKYRDKLPFTCRIISSPAGYQLTSKSEDK